ncbi:MAG: hypothetical protein AAB612_04045 [Patescibacteria group bacterium]
MPGTTEQKLSNFIVDPDGRNRWIDVMLQYEKNRSIEDPYTEEENRQLYGIQFDRAVSYRKHEDGKITAEEYIAEEDRLNEEVRVINLAMHARRSEKNHTNQ